MYRVAIGRRNVQREILAFRKGVLLSFLIVIMNEHSVKNSFEYIGELFKRSMKILGNYRRLIGSI